MMSEKTNKQTNKPKKINKEQIKKKNIRVLLNVILEKLTEEQLRDIKKKLEDIKK